jgi:hypothetical protein
VTLPATCVPISPLDDGRRLRKCSYAPSPQWKTHAARSGLLLDYRLAAHQGVEEGDPRDGDESAVDAAESKEEKSGSSVFVVTGKQESTRR